MRHSLAKALACAAALAAALATPAAAGPSLIRDAEIERTLRQMSAPVFQAAGYRPDRIDIHILNDRTLNAFVANGNNMFLNSGLLSTLETPEELLGVIAHETGHIAGGHLARREINLRNARGPAMLGMLVAIAAAVAGGAPGAVAVAAESQSAVQRVLLKYSRAEEATADQAGLDYLARARIDPAGLMRVLERFRSQMLLIGTNVDPFIQTHPLSQERIQLLERRVAEAAGKTFPANPDRIYWHARMRAKLSGFLDSPERVLDSLDGEPDDEFTLYARAIALYRLPDLPRALETADRLNARRPHDPFYIELKGQFLFETGQAAEALPLYREAVRLAPDEPLLLAGLGRVLLAQKNAAADGEALDVLQKARRRDPGDPAGLHALADAYARAGDDGMAALATAERYALVGDAENAKLLAGRAATVLPEGSPGWLRAQDILSLKTD